MATQAELEQRIADLEKRIAGLQAEATPGGVFALMDQLFPPETRQHLRAARKEQLLAFRSLLDKWIARLDEDKPAPKREAIRVE
jgi:BMFP domain-containing protein YqiC